jgi:lysophospholipase L1-like esterase
VDPDAANYAHRQSLFEVLPRPKNRIVFAGDSLTQGCEWGEFYWGALNRGIGGDTSAGLLKRIGSITEVNPRAVFLMIGSNDLFNLGLSPGQTMLNIGATVAEIRRASPEASIYLESNLPTWNLRKNVHARAVNEGLRSLADGKTVVYIDFYQAFLDGEILSPKLTSDGGHLNGAGYLLWKRSIEPYVSHLVQ